MSTIAQRFGMYSRPQWFITVFGGLLALLLPVFGAAVATTLSLSEALRLAEQQSPDLAAELANVTAMRSASVSAGALPDPQLILGVENLPTSGVDSWSLNRDFMTMQKIGMMQEIPNGKKRQAQIDAAHASVRQAEATQRVQRLALRYAVATAWLNRFYLERRVALLDGLDRENQLWAGTVQAQLAADRGMPADVLMPQQEAAELADRRDGLNAELLKAKSALRRYIGMAADAPLSVEVPLLAFDSNHLRAHVHEHPELLYFTPMLEYAQAEVRAAEAAKRPDWGVEVSYARRGPAYSDMVSAQVTVGLPLFSAHRQDPQIAAKRQAVTRLNAERDAMLREHTELLEAELADDEALRRQVLRVQDTRLPLAQQRVELQMASYRAGKSDLNTVLSARRDLLETQLKFIELQAQRAAIAAKLYFAYEEGAQ